jgi:hypothetical protein
LSHLSRLIHNKQTLWILILHHVFNTHGDLR